MNGTLVENMEDPLLIKIRQQVAAMPIEEKQQLAVGLVQKELEHCKNDLLYWLTEYVYSLDEHDKENPVKKLPMEKEYLRDMVTLFLNERLLLIEKSRQMMVTWFMVAAHLWDAMFHAGRRIAFQSKKEQDANNLVDRAKFIYEHLPEFMKQVQYRADPYAYCKLQFGKLNSIIQGIPQGPEQLRQYTYSRVFNDEMPFQEQKEEAYIAALPTIKGGGSYIGCGSPNFKEFFYLLKSDKI